MLNATLAVTESNCYSQNIRVFPHSIQHFVHMAASSPSPTEAVADIFTGEKLLCLNEPLAREFGFNAAYRGFWMGKEVGVRRLQVEDCQENWLSLIGKLQDGSLSHDNVLKVFGCEDDGLGQWRYTFP